jgi:hypothetical protein
MARPNGYESLEYDIARRREEQKQIVDALKTLFDLLEEYAPSWYTEEHHRQALSALEVTASDASKYNIIGSID